LESPLGWNQMNRAARVAQCKQSVELLDQAPEEDVLLAGDTNWGPDDGTPPLPGGWSDAWLHLHSGDPGLTYDPKANPMLKPGNRIRRRLDRVWVKLSRWRLHRMELVGREALPGLQFEGRPVLPSDHFGLLLILCLRA
jgi:tyrosyl-DNA phosphodiesterase 2